MAETTLSLLIYRRLIVWHGNYIIFFFWVPVKMALTDIIRKHKMCDFFKKKFILLAVRYVGAVCFSVDSRRVSLEVIIRV